LKISLFSCKTSYHIDSQFLQTKINVNRRNFSGNTALHTAVVTQGAKAREIYALLLKYGADPYIKNHNLPDV